MDLSPYIDKAKEHLAQHHRINSTLRFSALMAFIELQFDRMKEPPSHHVIFSIACLAWSTPKQHNRHYDHVVISH